MLKKLLCSALTVFALCAASLSAQTVDEILEKNLKAHGGKEKIKSVQTVKMTGKMMMGGGMEMPFVMYMKQPNMSRMEMSMQGQKFIQGFDGKIGWMVNPFSGSKEAEQLPAEQTKDMEDRTLEPTLLMYKEKGWKIEYVGKEDVEGTPAYKIKLQKTPEETSYLFIDVDSGMELKVAGKRNMQGTEAEAETLFGDFKEIGGVMFAHSMEIRVVGMAGGMQMIYEKIEVNPSVDNTIFAMPAKK